MNLPELNEVLRKLQSEYKDSNNDLITFYEEQRIKLIQRIKHNIANALQHETDKI